MVSAYVKGTVRYASAAEWFCLVAGSLLVQRYFWYMDDAFIYFRYVDNWVLLGRGLTFNQGEFVEGFSSPLWTLILGPLRWIGLEYPLILRALAAGSFVLFWALAVRVNRRLSPRGPAVDLPLAYLTFCYGAACYFSSGLETPLVQVAAVACALLILHPASRPLQLLVGLMPLLRPELVVPFGLVGLWVWRRNRRLPPVMTLTAAVTVGGWLLFRVGYYADLLPNTFYLKNEVHIAQGLAYVQDTAGLYKLHYLFLVLVSVAVVLKLRCKQPIQLFVSERVVMLLAGLSVAAYEIKIGGDARHYRVLAFPFCLTVFSLGGIAEHALVFMRLDRFALAAPSIALGLGLFAFLRVPPQLDRHPITLAAEVKQVNKINDAQWHRLNRVIASMKWMEGTSSAELRAFRQENPDYRYEYVRNGPLCANLYNEIHVRIIHGPGFSDALLARTEMESRRPGHKPDLRPLALDIVDIHAQTPDPGPGMYRAAIERGSAPEWVARNIDTIEVIEKKIYNRHAFFENLALALTFPPKIVPDPYDLTAKIERGRNLNQRIAEPGFAPHESSRPTPRSNRRQRSRQAEETFRQRGRAQR